MIASYLARFYDKSRQPRVRGASRNSCHRRFTARVTIYRDTKFIFQQITRTTTDNAIIMERVISVKLDVRKEEKFGLNSALS